MAFYIYFIGVDNYLHRQNINRVKGSAGLYGLYTVDDIYTAYNKGIEWVITVLDKADELMKDVAESAARFLTLISTA